MSSAFVASKKGYSQQALNGCACGGSIVEEMRVSELCWVLLIVLLLLQQPLLNITSIAVFSYVDEAAVTVIVTAAVAKVMRNRGVAYLRRGERIACGIGLALLLWVFVCNYEAGVQTSPTPLLIDALTCSKFVIVIIGSLLVFDGNRLVRLLEPAVKVILAVMVPCWLLNTLLPGGFSMLGQDMWFDVRYGIRSFQFIFGHPEIMNMMVLSMMLLLLNNRSRNSKWIVVCLLMITTSLRSKGLAFVAIAIMFLLSSRNQKKIGFVPIVLCAFAAVLIGWDQFEYYYGADSGARAEMTRASLAIASDFFPFGTGFATFGSNITSEVQYYSPLYVSYGLSNIYGLSLTTGTDFLSDTFWPAALAQFGWIGLIGYVVILVLLFKSIYSRAATKGQELTCILFGAYLVILSTSGSSFFHPSAMVIAITAIISITYFLESESGLKASDLPRINETIDVRIDGCSLTRK